MTTHAHATTLAGRYELGPMIGQGGMSQVWMAHDHRLDRDVAVKVLHPGLSSTPINRGRFEREALAAARINHPNVVSVFDAGECDGELYIVMECLPGHTLYDEMARGPLAVDRARSLALQVLRGLGAAHRMGIIHRDIKPGNVLFAADGSAKLADFGIAKFTEAHDLTQTGQMIGTAAYMPPERLTGADASASGDLYSLGVVLYEALAGRRPFEGDTPLGLVQAISSSTPPPIQSLRPEVDGELARAIEGATERDPARRFGSAASMSAVIVGVAPVGVNAGAPARRSVAVGGAAPAVDLPTAIDPTVIAPQPPATAVAPRVALVPSMRPSSTGRLVAVVVGIALVAVLLLATTAASRNDRQEPALDVPGPTVTSTLVVAARPAPTSATTAVPVTLAPTTAAPVGPGKGKGKGKDDD